jgi:hypothetical protein
MEKRSKGPGPGRGPTGDDERGKKDLERGTSKPQRGKQPKDYEFDEFSEFDEDEQ